MLLRKQIYTIVFLITFLCFFCHHLFAQKATKIDLVSANTMEFDVRINKDVKRLLGNVILQHNNTMLYCDSAYLYSEGNSVDAFGNVRINSGRVNISSNELNYDGNTKIAVLRENVILADGQMTLSTDRLTYDLSKDVGNYDTGGKIIDAENTLTSVIGFYYANEKDFFFKKNVVLINPEYTMHCDTLKYNTNSEVSYFMGPTTIVSKNNTIYCENGWYDTKNDKAQFNKNAVFSNKDQTIIGDSLFYDRINSIGKAFKNITISDTIQDIKIKGEFAFYNEKDGSTLITEQAELIQIIESDTLFLHADTLFATFDSTRTGKLLQAYHRAKFFKTDLQGLGDSLVYSFKDSTIFMFNNPLLWTDENQLSADTIHILMKNKKIDRLNLFISSFVISREDSLKFNQIKGKYLTGFFSDNQLKRIHVKDNGETVYYVRDSDNSLIGVNIAQSDIISINIEEKKVQTISFIKNPEATLFPESELSEKDTKLKNFRWIENKRPLSRKDIFIWMD